MKFCFATTDTILTVDFVGIGFRRLILGFFTTMLEWVLKKYGHTIPWDCSHLLHNSCMCARSREGDGTTSERHVGVFRLCGNLGVLRQEGSPHPAALLCKQQIPVAEAGLQGMYTYPCVYSWYGCVGVPTWSKDALGLFTVFAKEFQPHTRQVVFKPVAILLKL